MKVNMERTIWTMCALAAILLCTATAWAEDWDLAKAQPITYAVVKAEKVPKAQGRTMLRIRIVPATHDATGKVAQPVLQDSFTKENMAATIASAAKHHARTNFVEIVSVVMDAQFLSDAHGSTMLGSCDFFKDGQGFSGTERLTWSQFTVAERGLTERELHIQQLWSAHRQAYVDSSGSLNEAALTAYIAKALNIGEDQINLPYLEMIPVPDALGEEVDAVPPLQNK